MRIILDIPILLSEAVSAIGSKMNEKRCDRQIYAICTDSRECELYDLFFSLASLKEDRLKNADDAASRGAICICDVGDYILVPDTGAALLRLSAFYKSKLPRLLHTVGITGSIGKSTCKRFVADVLSGAYRVSGTIGNFNNRIGISLSILSASRDTEVLVLEMGMNHSGEILEMSKEIRPDICVITNIGTAHIGNLGSREAIRDAKCEIISDAAVAVIVPSNESLLDNVKHRVGVSLSDMADAKRDESANTMLLHGDNGYTLFVYGKKICDIHPKSTLRRDLYALLIAGVTATVLGMEKADIEYALNNTVNDRAERRIISLGDITLIDDTYNSSPEAVEYMLEYLSDFPSPRFAVLSDMLELGDMAKELHYRIGGQASCLDGLYVIGEYADIVARGAIDGGMAENSVRRLSSEAPEKAADLLMREVKRGTILLKGSHATGLSGVVKILCERMKK